MDVVIAGSSGLIGTALSTALTDHGHEVVRLVRRPAGQGEVEWDPASGVVDAAVLDGVDAVINLAGAGIGDRRWTDSYRELLVSSRVSTTTVLAEASATVNTSPRVFVGGSAIGIYGDRGSEELTEHSTAGQGFLADLVRDWETAAQPAADAGIRTVFLRSGIVLSTEGGVLPKFLPLFKLGLGGRFGSGDQYMSWISIDDEIAAILRILDDPSLVGPVNLTAPNPVTGAEFTRTLAEVLGRPSFLPVPEFGPRLLLGRDRADALLFEGQRVLPEALTGAGFDFDHPTLMAALSDLLGRR
jgi:uncharacterized protein (TIGR01777 family)